MAKKSLMRALIIAFSSFACIQIKMMQSSEVDLAAIELSPIHKEEMVRRTERDIRFWTQQEMAYRNNKEKKWRDQKNKKLKSQGDRVYEYYEQNSLFAFKHHLLLSNIIDGSDTDSGKY